MICGMSATAKFGVPVHRRVLVDGGASKVIRPYDKQWWNDIKFGRRDGKTAVMKLAGNGTANAVMTERYVGSRRSWVWPTTGITMAPEP